MSFEQFRAGDVVTVTAHGQTKAARVSLASYGGHSLALDFDGGLFGVTGGAYIGTMPVLWDEGMDEWVELINGTAIRIARA